MGIASPAAGTGSGSTANRPNTKSAAPGMKIPEPPPLLLIALLLGSRKSSLPAPDRYLLGSINMIDYSSWSENLTRFLDLGETIGSLLRNRFEKIHFSEGQYRNYLL